MESKTLLKHEIIIEHHSYVIEIKTGFPLKWTSSGKTWNRTTQCLFWVDGLLFAFAEVRRHDSDTDNINLAVRLAVKRVFEKRPFWKGLRMMFWDLILKQTNHE